MGEISTPVSLVFILRYFLSQDLNSYLIRNQQYFCLWSHGQMYNSSWLFRNNIHWPVLLQPDWNIGPGKVILTLLKCLLWFVFPSYEVKSFYTFSNKSNQCSVMSSTHYLTKTDQCNSEFWMMMDTSNGWDPYWGVKKIPITDISDWILNTKKIKFY